MNTQLPYVLTVAAVSFVAYVAAPFVGSAWIALPLAVALMLATLFFLRLILKGAVDETSAPAIFRKFAQSVNDAALSAALNRMAKGMLADGKIDLAESAELMKLLDGMEGREAFRQALASARADGVLTLEESAGLESFVRRIVKGGN